MKKIQFFVSIFLIMLGINAQAQIPESVWAKQSGLRGCDFYTDVIEDANNGYTVIGAVKQEANSFDCEVLHFNENGEVLWEKTVGTAAKEIPKRIAQLSDKSYIIIGTSEEGETQSCLLLHLDADGNELWSKTLEKEYLSVEDIIALQDNSFALAGSKGESTDDPKILMAILNENGEITLENTFLTDLSGCARSIKKLPDGDFALAAQVGEPAKNNCDIVAIRMNNEGKAKWFSHIKTPDQKVWPECICCTSDSALMIVGWNGKCLGDINVPDPIFDYDLVLNKINSNGEILWTKSIDREGSEGGNALAKLPDGTFIVAGIKETSFLGKIGPWLLAVDQEGNEIGEKLLSLHFNNDHASRIINSSDGSIIVIGPGIQEESNSRSDGWIMKFAAL
ncbi:hypothetical protein SLH46_00395 [Draconibacterium sp. IB214405]|uniref:hypothetical protein n=1 Tax=Draconibacterium sp. IB214405 TaxID=3097352 RepID=UPI002A0CF911|nr:hypothetical protein [Draconibacterium sp. IB214405]MDX8337618.1 hypothetical protein [Draconibacterium sp. IB214405]